MNQTLSTLEPTRLKGDADGVFIRMGFTAAVNVKCYFVTRLGQNLVRLRDTNRYTVSLLFISVLIGITSGYWFEKSRVCV